MVAETSSVGAPMTQAMSAGKTRAVSIVPAVPRKFERKTQPSTKGTSRIEADAKEPEQSGKDLSEHSNHVMNESNLGPANPEEVEEEVSKTSKGASVIVQNTGEGKALLSCEQANKVS